MPVTPTGLTSGEISILQNAKTEGATVSLVNIMTFDYYTGQTYEMASATESAAQALYSELQSLNPGDTSAQLWSMIGITEMPGIDDYGSAETFTEADATTVLNWAEQQGVSTLSFWALERDNGGCVGTGGQDSCSGIAQPTWYFSNTFAPFTSGSTTPPPTNGFSVSVSPSSASVAAGSSASATVGTAVTSGSAQSVALSASGLPSGVTATFSPTSVTAGSSSKVTFATTSSTANGTYPITITGKGTSASETATYTLTVTGGTTSSGGSLVNGNFETGSLSPWTAQSGDAVESTTVHAGKYALAVAATSSATGEADQSVTLQPNTTYKLSGWVEGSYAFIGVSGGATGDTWTSSSSWSQESLTFTTGSSGAVTVYVHGWYGLGTVYADDFTLTAS
jgi:hypothetical protein